MAMAVWDIIIRNATIITQNKKREIIEKGDILIKGNKIEKVSSKTNEKAKIDIDGTNKIAMPGLVNMHTHVAMTILRGYGEGLPLQQWLEKKIWPIEAKQTSEDAHAAAMLAFCEMIRSGTTCFSEMCILGSKEIKQAAEKIGIRGVVGHGLLDSVPGRNTKEQIKLMKETVYEKSELIQSSIAPHSPYTCSEELLVKSKEFAKQKTLRYQIHVSETRKEVLDILQNKKKQPIEYLDGLGIVDKDSIFVHGSWVSKKEIGILGKKKANICHCPVSSLKLATGGICPITEYSKAGANVVLGTDGVASNNSLNMFETMKMASLLQKHKYWKADVVNAQEALDLATINAAKALGKQCGVIEPGKLADILLLEKGPNLWPVNNIVSNIVYAANPSNVSDVIINGKIIMKSRNILTVDEAKLIAKAEKVAKEIKKR